MNNGEQLGEVGRTFTNYLSKAEKLTRGGFIVCNKFSPNPNQQSSKEKQVTVSSNMRWLFGLLAY